MARVIEKKLLRGHLVREQANRDRCGLRFVVGLVPYGPVGTAFILRVQHPIAALFIEELLDIFTVRVEDNSDFPTSFDLINDLPNQRRLTRSCIARDLDVVYFSIEPNDQVFAAIIWLQKLEGVSPIAQSKPQSIALRFAVELPATDQAGAAEQLPVTSAALLLAIKNHPAHDEHKQAPGKAAEWPCEDAVNGAVAIDV